MINTMNTMKEKYYDQAVACVKDYVLPAQIKLFQSCDGNLDKVYGEAMNGNGYFRNCIAWSGALSVPNHKELKVIPVCGAVI